MKIRPIALFLLIFSSVLIFGTTFAQDKPDTDITSKITRYSTFLKDRYELTLKDEVEQSQFTDAAKLIGGTVEIPSDLDLEGFTNLEAVFNSVYYANLDELALTYP